MFRSLIPHYPPSLKIRTKFKLILSKYWTMFICYKQSKAYLPDIESIG